MKLKVDSGKGAKNLIKFNTDRSIHIKPQLVKELQIYKKRKMYFKTVGLLASYLSERIKVHRTTLIRNPAYQAMLLEHIGTQPGSVTRAPDSTLDPHLLQVKLASARLEAANVCTELRILKASHVQSELIGGNAISKSDIDFANLAMCLVNILVRFDDSLSLDFQKRELLDLAAKPSDRKIVGIERIGVFLTWIEQNQYIPIVAQVVKIHKGLK